MAAEAAASLVVTPHRLVSAASPAAGLGAGDTVGARGVRDGAVDGGVGGHAGDGVGLPDGF